MRGMHCPSEQEFFLFSAGLLAKAERLEILRHLAVCPDCRESFESRRGAIRDRMIDEASEREYLPPDRSELRKRVLGAVARDRVERKPVLRRSTHPLHPRVALVAAAALILAFIGVRYLGDMRWKGRLEVTSDARLLVTSGADAFEIVSDTVRTIGPGEIVLVLPGQSGRIFLPDGSIVRLPAPALVALDTYADQPRVMVGRGYVRIESSGGQPVAVNAGGQIFTVEGIAEFDVQEPSPHHAFQWAVTQAFTYASASFISQAHAAPGQLRARVTVHAIQGRVLPQAPGGEIILTGQASSFGPGQADEGPERFGGKRVFEPASNILTDAEMASLGRVLVQTQGGRTELLELAGSAASPLVERQLAVWLIGEMGVKDATGELEKVISSTAPTCVRAAAVAALAKIADDKAAPWSYVDDPDPALADAALFGCARMGFPDARTQLRRVFENTENTDRRRIYAAALLHRAGHAVYSHDLAFFLSSKDRTAAALAVDLMVKLPGGDAGIAAVVSDVEPWLAARILERLAEVRYGNDPLIRYAGDVLAETTGDPDPAAQARFRASLHFLRTNDAGELRDAIAWAIREGEYATRRVALRSLLWRNPGETLMGLGGGLREHLEKLLLDPTEPAELRTIVFPAFLTREDILETLHDDASPEVNAKARIRLLDSDAEGSRRELADATLHHQILEARTAAWNWFAGRDRDELLTRAEAWLATDESGDVDAIVSALDRAFGSDGPVPPPENLDLDLRERAARVAEMILNRPPSRNATDVVVAGVIGYLAVAGSPHARRVCRELALSEDRPADLRLPAALALGSYARAGPEIEAVAQILVDGNVDLASATASSFTVRHPPEELVLALRRHELHPGVRARLALAAPFDHDYARAVLTAGDDPASRHLLLWMRQEEADRVRTAVAQQLSNSEVGIRTLALRLLALGEGPIDMPDSLVSDPDPWLRVLVLADRVVRGAEPEMEAIASASRAADPGSRKDLGQALRVFAESPTPDTARALFRLSRDAPAARTARHDDAPLPEHLLSLEQSRERQRGLALSRLDSVQSASLTWSAVETLGNAGGRAHLAHLFRIAGESGSEAVRRVAIRAAGALLAREFYVAQPGPALDELKGWWRDRAFALEVPVLPRGNE